MWIFKKTRRCVKFIFPKTCLKRIFCHFSGLNPPSLSLILGLIWAFFSIKSALYTYVLLRWERISMVDWTRIYLVELENL